MGSGDGLNARLEDTGDHSWQNKHLIYTSQLRHFYNLWNPPEEAGSNLDRYNATTQAIQGLIKQAQDENLGLRALGGGWSLSEAPATDGILVNTKPLNLLFNVGANMVDGAYPNAEKEKALRFAQCGNSILELHDKVNQAGRTLRSCGASNGQTIAGALSTGTHGAAIDAGSIANYVVGLHIVVGPARHVWLERASYPVMMKGFADRLGAEWIRNDDLFNAALISLGGFGFIHGVMIETDPISLFEMHRQHMPLTPGLRNAMNTLDFSQVTLPTGAERPYHFQVLVDPYELDQKGVSVTMMYRRPYRTDYTPPPLGLDGRGPGDDALALIGTITNWVPGSTKSIINAFMAGAFPDLAEPVFGTLGEIFNNTTTRGKTASTSMGIPLEFATRAFDLLVQLDQDKGPYAGLISLRFVAGNQATLGWQRWPKTCVIELDGAYSDHSLSFFDIVRQAVTDAGIPHTFHWGKMVKINPAQLAQMYGNAVDQWKSARAQLLDAPARKVFSSAFLEGMGLQP